MATTMMPTPALNAHDLMNAMPAANKLSAATKTKARAQVHRQPGYVLFRQVHPTSFRRFQADDHIEGGRLASAIRAQQAKATRMHLTCSPLQCG